MELIAWLGARSGIAHRRDATAAGFSIRTIRTHTSDGRVSVARRHWLILDDADPALRRAASIGGRLGCISLAERRGWWVPHGLETRIHVSMPPNRSRSEGDEYYHWTTPLVPPSPRELFESVEDSLRHIARCLPFDEAVVVWESAIRAEGLSAPALRLIPWRDSRALAVANACTGLSDSGLETFLVTRMSRLGVFVAQQVVLAGHRVDGLIGEWLVIQVDGHAHHSNASDRRRDAAHDAELTLRGFTVLRFTYAQVIHEWPQVERTILRAIAAGLHLRPRRS